MNTMKVRVLSLVTTGVLAASCSSNAASDSAGSAVGEQPRQQAADAALGAGRAVGAATSGENDFALLEQRVVAGDAITAASTSRLSGGELARLRNAVYARHGRTFRTSELQDYFASRPWYRANPEYSDSLLTAADQQNLAVLSGAGKTADATGGAGAAAEPDAAAEAAMSKFIKVMRNKDVPGFLALLSRERPWRHSSTMVSPGSPPDAETYSYEQTAKELRNREGLYIRLFVNDLTDSFAGNYLETDAMWKADGDRFVPPDAAGAPSSKVYVRWRAEGGRVVLDEIAYPSS